MARLLADPDPDVRRAAAAALASYGPAAKKALPELTRAMTTADSEMRMVLMRAVRSIDAAGNNGAPPGP
jgi:HEAT repeat protein